MDNIDINKAKKDFISFEDHIITSLQDTEYQKEFLNATIEEFLEDGDYDLFFQSLELVIKARESVSEIAKLNNIANPNRIYAGRTILIPNCRK